VAPRAENVVVAVLSGATLPLETDQAKVNGPVPPAVPLRATVANGGTVALNGTAGGTGPFTFAWSVSSGSVAPLNTATTTFSALGATSPVTATLTVTGACGTASASANITVDAPLAPTVATVAPLSAFSGARGSFTLTATDPNVPAQNVTFNVVQTGGPALAALSVTPVNGSSATVNFTAPLLPAGTLAPVTITLSATARNAGGATSSPATITLTVKPIPDQIAITTAQYRTGKQRIDLTVTSSVDNGAIVLKLQPYVTASGTTFDPSLLGNTLTYTGAATWTLTLVGAPEPAIPPAAPLTVTSSLGGVSPATALTSIRN